MAMSQLKREKIALVVFIVLVLVVGFGLVTYLNVGHSWNVAASNIDDAAGSMEGYTAIVYDGVGSPKSELDENRGTITTSSVVKSYKSKKASVLRLDTVDPSIYSEGSIVKVGDKRIGLFSVTSSITPTALQTRVDYFKEHDVDFIICIASDCKYVQSARGIDIVISLGGDIGSLSREAKDSANYVECPCVGKVGTILISPHNVVSSKAIEHL